MSYNPEGEIQCDIASYFLKDGDNVTKKVGEKDIRTKIVNRYEDIKDLSKSKDKAEKISQQNLFTLNNKNIDSKWFCFDVEWKKAYNNKDERDRAGFSGRFDILAISKDAPHKIAFIELKYGVNAIGGESGIKKHIEDYRMFSQLGYFDAYKEEAVSIIESLSLLGIEIPQSLKHLDVSQIDDTPYFYIASLDNENNKVKQCMARYLFNNKMWGVESGFSINNVEKELGINVLDRKSCSINLTFLFSNQTNDIIEGFEETIKQQ